MSTDLQSLVTLLSGAGLRFYHRLIRTLTLPNNAAPADPAIIIGPDMPPCMQSAYSAAIFWRPSGTFGGGAGGPPLFFLAQPKFSGGHEEVHAGFAVVDAANNVCEYVAILAFNATNTGTPTLHPLILLDVVQKSGGMTVTDITLGIGSSAGGTVPINTNIGTANQSPSRAPFTIDGASIGRGIVAYAASTAASGAIGAETVVNTTGNMTFYNGRCYAVEVQQELSVSVANRVGCNIRQGTLVGGTLLLTFSELFGSASQQHMSAIGYVRRTAGTDLTNTPLSLTLIASAGTVTQQGSATTVATLIVRDIGAAADYPSAISI